MKPLYELFDPWTEKLVLRDGYTPAALNAFVNALKTPVVVNSIAGTAIAGALSGSDKIFTRSAGYWIDRVRIPISSVSGTFVVNEQVTETTSSATGYIEEITGTYLVLKPPFATAQFTGAKTLTGGTSSATATGGTPVETLTNLKNQVAWAHLSGSTGNGKLVRISTNTATTFTTITAMQSTATAAIIFKDQEVAAEAMDIVQDVYKGLNVASTAAATYAVAASLGEAVVLIATTGSNAVAMTLPATYLVPEGQIYMVYVSDATTNAFTLVAASAADTLDGTDISAGGTPLATLNADGDHTVIQKRGGVWVTIYDGIA